MAVNKRKILEAARKNAQKGAKQKALKDYGTLLQLDARDAKLRLEIGDAHRRWGENEEAIGHYTKVAEQYQKDGFDARAVAVYKQILNLDPTRFSAYVSLSDLYQRMGLDSEAVRALQTAADGLHKEGKRREALELLRRMAGLDPGNTANRMRVGEMLHQEGLDQEAIQEFDAVATELERRDAPEQLTKVYERLLELQPKRVDVLVRLARNCIELRLPERAAPLARQAAELEPDETGSWELLCDIYKALEDPEALAEATRELARIHRERGDDATARQIMQRLPGSEALGDTPAPPVASDVSEVEHVDDDELLDDEFLTADEGASPFEISGSDLTLGSGSNEDLTQPDVEQGEPLAAEAALPEGDPEQLYAEASVYLRYGKRDEAIAALKAILVQDAEHRLALEKLGDAHAAAGSRSAAVAMWTQAAERARADDDAHGLAALRERIAALDPEAAAAIEPLPTISAEVTNPGVDAMGSLDLELELEELETDELDDDDLQIDVDLNDEMEDDLVAAGETPELDPLDTAGDEALDPLDDELEFASEDSEDLILSEPPDPDVSTATAAEIAEELEQAQFFFEQGMFDESDAAFQRVLERAPNHPTALVRMGELQALRDSQAADQDAANDAAVEVTAPAETMLSLDVDVADASDADEDAFDVDDALDAPVFEVELAAPDAEDEAPEDEAAIEFDVATDDVGDDDATPVPVAAADSDSTESVAASRTDDGITSPLVAEIPSDGPLATSDTDTQPVAAAAPESGELFDLAAELRDAIEEEDEAKEAPMALSGKGTEAEGFASLFSEFKKGVSATLEEGDHETRFDLGIAYREMGLLDDAIGEFTACLASPARAVESLQMMGLCAIELGRTQDAVAHLMQALSHGDLADQQRAGLLMDLARAYESGGDAERARDALGQLQAIDANWPGAAELLASLGSGTAAPVAADEAGAEAYESFDDLIAEAEAEGTVREAIGQGAATASDVTATQDVSETEEIESVESSDEAGATASKKKEPKKRGKKRISFV